MPPVRVNVPISARVNGPPRFTVQFVALIVPALLQALVEELDWSPRFSGAPGRDRGDRRHCVQAPFKVNVLRWPAELRQVTILVDHVVAAGQRQAGAAAGKGRVSQVARQAADVQTLAIAGRQRSLVG